MLNVQSLKQQCLEAVECFSVDASSLPRTLVALTQQMKKCCFSFDAEAAASNGHDACLERAKLNQLACCSGNYFCTAVWNDHYRCARRIARARDVDSYLKTVGRETSAAPKVFLETRAVVKYLMERDGRVPENVVVWVASQADFETLALLLRWGCQPKEAVFRVVLADTAAVGRVDYAPAAPSDGCSRVADKTLEPGIAFVRQCMRKSNASCLEALLEFAPSTEKHAKRALVYDNLQCLVVLERRGCPLPKKAVCIAIRWDSVDCLRHLLLRRDASVDNSALGLAIEKRSFRCAKLLFSLGHSRDLALYYCTKFRCFQLLKYFTENGCLLGGLEILIDDCLFLKTALAVDCLHVPGVEREKVEIFFASPKFEQYKINQQLAFRGDGNNIELFSLLRDDAVWTR